MSSPAISLGYVLQHLRRGGSSADGQSDAELMDDFVQQRDEGAFVALLRRHGPMVWGVCRRVLHHHADAEDAFQATFLILVRKAATLDRRAAVGNWLYGVAQRTALKARTVAGRRRDVESEAGRRPRPEPRGLEWEQLHRLLDQELARLPDRYRSAIVLCDLQGQAIREAAQQLGCPQGTVASRLARGRDLLARRLARHGLTLAAGGLLVSIGRAEVPSRLVESTAQMIASGAIPTNILTLTQGVLQSMFLTKLKFAIGALLVLGLAIGGARVFEARAEKPKPEDKGKAAQEKGDKAQKGDKTDKKPDKGDKTEKKPDKGEKGEKKPAPPSITGTLKAIDEKKITVSVPVGKGKESEEKVLDLGKDVKVILLDILTKEKNPPEGKLSDLTPGTYVSAQLSEDKKTVVSISARGPGLHSAIKSVDAGKNTFTVWIKGDSGKEEINLTMADGAKVLLNDGLAKGDADKEGKLGDLTEGTPVMIQLTVDRKRALSVRPQGNGYHGTLKGIDTGNSTVTISVKEDGQIVDKSFTLAKNARVDSGASAGDRVNVRLSVFDDKVAVHVQGVEK